MAICGFIRVYVWDCFLDGCSDFLDSCIIGSEQSLVEVIALAKKQSLRKQDINNLDRFCYT